MTNRKQTLHTATSAPTSGDLKSSTTGYPPQCTPPPERPTVAGAPNR